MSRRDTIDISWPLNRPAERGTWDPNSPDPIRPQHDLSEYFTNRRPLNSDNEGSDDDDTSRKSKDGKARIPAEFYPSGKRSLSGIAVRAYLLGLVFGACLMATLVLLFLLPSLTTPPPERSSNPSPHSNSINDNYNDNDNNNYSYSYTRYWRPAFFLATLSLFHFLEFYTTATYNIPHATISSFLLTTNGRGYNAANAAALLECLLTPYFFPTWQSRRFVTHPAVIAAGLALVVLGQVVRSVAMAQAGTNFNHHVQTRRNEGHVLVRDGVYAWLRHPSYFGFFWWAVGTQVVVGNVLCSVVYAVVLWRFFRYRIEVEEKLLLGFFANEYRHYRSSTIIGIPFIG